MKLNKEEVEMHKAFPLWGDRVPPYAMEHGSFVPTIMPYLASGAKKAVVIFPGGGYFQLSVASEGIAIAKAYNDAGFSAFVVTYRYKPCDGRAILADGQRAMQFVRYHAEDFGIDREKIALCGFSAGGHLAVMTAEHKPMTYFMGDTIGLEDSRPNACVLGYPVVTLGDGTFPTMPVIFLGEKSEDGSLIERYSYSFDLSAMPPTFLWYSKNDEAVDPQKNAERLYEALKKLDTPCECHAYSDGRHGIGLGKDFEQYSLWHEASVRFLNNILK